MNIEQEIEDIKIRLAVLEARPERKRITRPADVDVSGYFMNENLPHTDALWFMAHMDGNGWTNNGRAVKCWKATIRAWKLAKIFPSQKQQAGGSGGASLFTLNDVLKRKEQELKDWKNKHFREDALGGEWTNKLVFESYKRMKDAVNKLKQEIDQKL